MSIFPERATRKSAEHNGAEPRAQRAAQQHTSNAQAQRPGEAGTAASKTHRFDKFARRVGATLLGALRTALTVFDSPNKERWPMVRLLSQLKGAEELAREMLREIAAKLTILPGKLREREGAPQPAPEEAAERAPYFRLGVETKNTCRHPGLREAQDRDLPPQRSGVEAGGPPNKSADDESIDSSAVGANRDDDTLNESSLAKRLTALQDVLSHPGRHAARMARALYRASHEPGGRLLAKSPDDMMLDTMNQMIGAFQRQDGAGFEALYGKLPKYEPG